jgi:pimeloyl-ACP methyl ester carboxylesterase
VATFALIHGAGDVGWYWHLLEAELRARGHGTVAPDLPIEDDSAGLDEFADTVAGAVGDRPGPLVVVGHSYGAFTAPLVAARRPAQLLVLLAGMIPRPGEAPDDWWYNTGYMAAARAQAERDGGKTGHPDPLVGFYHDVPPDLAKEALRRGDRAQSPASGAAPWPLDAWPDVPTRFILCRDDRFFPADFMRRLAAERRGGVASEIDGGHCVALSRPEELADVLTGLLADAVGG